ncbi:MAG TPA: permease-like cell division protein FtsX [Steroidobacteraceae bacterium]|nr:permease-like cell division protein FtsX [Steroidobacteraceae bacterium]
MSGVSTWGARHAQAMLGAVGRLARMSLATFLTITVIGVALAIPVALALVVHNARVATGDFRNAIDFTVHFKLGTPIARVEQLAKQLRERDGIDTVIVTPAEQALQEFRRVSGFGEALAALEDNPLPHHLLVRPKPENAVPTEVESLRRYLAAWPEVDIVQLDSDWVRRFNAILDVLRRGLWGGVFVLGLGVLAVVGNTIRLEIQHRRAEIEVTKLVGGSNAFVRRPFLYTGTLYGLAGALLAALLIWAGVSYLDRSVAALAAQYGSKFQLAGLSWRDFGTLAGVGAILGWVGALISTGRHLRRIEPRA